MSKSRNRSLIIIAVIGLVVIFGATALYTFYTANQLGTISSQQTTTSVQTTSSSASTSSSLGASTVTRTSIASTLNNNYSSSWLTYHRDNQRDGYDPNEPSVTSIPPGVAWQSPILDGAIYAEPLVSGGMVYAVTENDSVYALSETTGQIAWREKLGNPVPGNTLPCGDIDPSGITGTPAIDSGLNLIFVVAYLNPPQHHVLFALKLDSGAIAFQRDVDPPGVTALVEQERGALGIANGMVYIPYGGLAGDCGEYHGYVLGVPENNSGSTLSYQDPTGREGGIWAPSGLSIDSAGDIFVTTGNSASSNQFDFGDAVIRLSSTLQEEDYFAPTNWAALNAGDTDLGSLAPSLLGNNTIFQIGKQGVGYLLNQSHLGNIGGQEFNSTVCGYAFGGTAFAYPVIYVPCGTGTIALKVDFSSTSFSEVWKGPSLSLGPPIVAGGAVWTVDSGTGILHALHITNGTELYNHYLGSAPHFVTPSAAGGYVFVAGGNSVYAFSI